VQTQPIVASKTFFQHRQRHRPKRIYAHFFIVVRYSSQRNFHRFLPENPNRAQRFQIVSQTSSRAAIVSQSFPTDDDAGFVFQRRPGFVDDNFRAIRYFIQQPEKRGFVRTYARVGRARRPNVVDSDWTAAQRRTDESMAKVLGPFEANVVGFMMTPDV
jgi:hypothetical protein